MRKGPWVAVGCAVATGFFVLVTTYLVRWTTTGIWDALTTLLPVPIAFACGLHGRRYIGLAACAWMAATVEVTQGFNPFVLVITLGPWLAGAIILDRQQVARRLAEVGREIEAESERLADQAVKLERARVARELHDIVAHCVSVMVVQAYAGERLAVARRTLGNRGVRPHRRRRRASPEGDRPPRRPPRRRAGQRPESGSGTGIAGAGRRGCGHRDSTSVFTSPDVRTRCRRRPPPSPTGWCRKV